MDESKPGAAFFAAARRASRRRPGRGGAVTAVRAPEGIRADRKAYLPTTAFEFKPAQNGGFSHLAMR